MPARKSFSIKCKRATLELGKRTAIMGILNITPDSFSDGGIYYQNVVGAVEHARLMLDDGADIIDIGGESTRPGSDFVTTDQEIQRVIPVIKSLRQTLGKKFLISIDTNKAQVAERALQEGADIVNSLSGFDLDPKMAGIVKKYKCPIIIYHIKGKPKTMQKGKILYKDAVREIKEFFKSQIQIAQKNAISRKQLILDPGVGFGKVLAHNLELLTRLHEFSGLNLPILIGVSRKSHLGIMLKEQLHLSELPGPTERLEAALAETGIAIQNGAHIIRTHDVMQTKRFAATMDVIVQKAGG